MNKKIKVIKKHLLCCLVLIPIFSFSQKKMVVKCFDNSSSGLVCNSKCKITFIDNNVIFNTGDHNSFSLPIGSIQKISFEEDPSTGIETEVDNMEVRVSPNPATSYIKLYFTDPFAVSINIFDLNGHLVKNIQSVKSEEAISINDLTSGVYFITLSSNNKMIKFIKQ